MSSSSSTINLAVLVSGSGRTLQNFIDLSRAGELPVRIPLVIGSKPNLLGLKRAAHAGIPHHAVERKSFPSPAEFSARVFSLCDEAKIDLVAFAGWLCLLPIPDRYLNRVMNIHPALLPSFGGHGMYGHHVHQAVLDHGCKVSGCTVHFVDNTYDTGPIIVQRTCPVLDADTADTLAARVFAEETVAYPDAVRLFAANRLKVDGRCVLTAPPVIPVSRPHRMGRRGTCTATSVERGIKELPMRRKCAALSIATVLALTVGCQTNPETRHPQAARPADDAPLAQSASAPGSAPAARAAQRQSRLELVSTFTGPMPTGIAVSADNRVFVSFPRWADPVETTCGELRDGRLIPFPSAQINKLNKDDPANTFVSIQSVVVDPSGQRLWLVDAGNINFGRNLEKGPKLIAVDLATNQITRTIHFPDTVARPHSYLNDVRFDLRRGEKGFAYLTDSSVKGENGIIVVDLATGQSWRKLDKHPSVLPTPDFAPTLEGEADNPLRTRSPLLPDGPITVGSDGIAISPDGKTLYYRPLASRHLYSVPTDLLADRDARADQVASAVKDHGNLGFASDGLESDAQGRVYLTDYEYHAVRVVDPSQSPTQTNILVQDPRLIWPDTLFLARDGWLYVTANQLNRQPQYHNGKDLRDPPYALFRVHVEAKPIAGR